VHVATLEEKDALLRAEPTKLTTTPHYDGYRMVLVVLSKVAKAELREFVTESWRLRAPKKLVAVLEATESEHTTSS
jgi:hypothetical protein